MSDFTTLGIRIDTSQVRQANKDLNKLAKTEKSVTKSTLGMDKAFRSIAKTLSVLALFQTTKNLTQLADKMNLLDSRIKVATKSIEDYNKAQKLLVDLSLRTGTSFEANTTIFVRTNKAIESLGGSIHTTSRFTETLAKSLVISGTTAGETTSVIRQMSQALASGVLRGDEFNSISENGARIQQLLTDSLGVTAGELRTMAEHGELTSQRVINAMLEQSKVIDEEYKRMPKTVARAIENVNTAFGQYILLADRGSGATAGIADNIQVLADNMIPIIDSIVTFGKVLGALALAKVLENLTAIARSRMISIDIEKSHTAAIIENGRINQAAKIAEAKANVEVAESAYASAVAKERDLNITKNHIVMARQDELAVLAEARANIEEAESLSVSSAAMTENTTATKLHSNSVASYSAALRDVTNLEIHRNNLSKELMLAEKAGAIALKALIKLELEQTKAIVALGAASKDYLATKAAMNIKRTEAALKIRVETEETLRGINAKIKDANATFNQADAEIVRIAAQQKSVIAIRDNLNETLKAATSKKILAEATLKESLVTEGNTNIHAVNAAALTAGSIADTKKAESLSSLSRLGAQQASVNEKIAASQIAVSKTAKDAAKANVILESSVKKIDIATKGLLATYGLFNLTFYAYMAFEAGKWARSVVGDTVEVIKITRMLERQYDNVLFAYKSFITYIGQSNIIYDDLLEQHQKQSAAFDEETRHLINLANGYMSSGMTIDAYNKHVDNLAESNEKSKEITNSLIKAAVSYKDALMDEFLQLTMSARAYEEYKLGKLGILGVDREQLLSLWDKIRAIELEEAAIENANAAYKSHRENVQNVIDALIDENLQLSISAEEYQRVTLAKQGLTGADLEMAIALSESNESLREQADLIKEVANITLAARTPLEVFVDKSAALSKVYNASDMKLKVYIKTLGKYQKELDKSNAKKATKDINKYGDTLKDIDKRLKDVSATSLDIFSGPAEGINGITQALLAMTEALSKNNKDIEDNATAYMDYIFTTNDALDERIKKTKDFQKRQELLEEKATSTKLQSVGIVSQAISGALSQAAAEAEEGSKKQEALQKAAIGMQMVTATALGAVAVIRGFAEGGFPLAIATAAAVAIQLGVLGAQIAQVSGGVQPSELQQSQGRGSVLGDEDALSESLGNSMEILEDYASIGNDHSSRMLISLQNIDNNTKALAIGISRSEVFSEFSSDPLGFTGSEIELSKVMESAVELGSSSAMAAGVILGDPIIMAFSKVMDKLFGEKSKIRDTGIAFGVPTGNEGDIKGQSFGDAMADGFESSFFARVDTWKQAAFFKFDSETLNPFFKMEETLNKQFNDIINNMGDAAIEGMQVLSDLSFDEITKKVSETPIGFEKISLKDLDIEETQEAIAAVFSKASDDLVTSILPNITGFQQVGEGLFETFVRVTGETESATTALEAIGLTAIKYTDVLNKQNDVAPQIVRDTIIMNEEFSAVADIMNIVTGDASELVNTYKELSAAQLLLIGTGLGKDTLSSDLVGASGGLGGLQTGLESFSDEFFSDQERFDMNLSNMQRSFSKLGQTMPTTKDAFRDLVLEIGASGDDKLLGQILQLSPSVAELSDDFDSLKDSMSELANILAGVERNFARLYQSDFEASLRGISDSFVETLESVMGAGGSVDDLLRVTSIGVQTGIKAVDDAKDALKLTFDGLRKTISNGRKSVTMDMAKIQLPEDQFKDVEKQALEQIIKTGSIEEQISAASQLQSMIMSNYDEQIASVESLTDAIASIQDYIDSLLLNDALSTLTPVEMLNEARNQFSDTLALAQTGDIDALNSITGISDEYLTTARAFYASSESYTSIFDGVLSSLEALVIPDAIDYDKVIADAGNEAVLELVGINDILNNIDRRAEAEYKTNVFTIDEETSGIYKEYINAVASLTGYLSSDVQTGLDSLPKFANGGIATSPSIAGEGSMNEAVIPLPDGRTVEARITGADANKSYAELISEIKGLREDMAGQTDAIIETNYDANNIGAEQVSDAVTEQGESMRWDNNKVEVV